MVRFASVGPEFFAAMQIPVVLGRDILASDSTSSPKVGVVNEAFVRKFFGDQNPIGHHFMGPLGDNVRFEIVGVIKDAELTDVHAEPMAKAFIPFTQVPDFVDTMYFEVRTAGDPAAIVPEVRDVVRGTDPDLPLMSLSTQIEQTASALTQERLFARLASFFGLTALLLACIGLYGTMAYSVVRKTHEIGIRMALGAKPGHVFGLVLRQGFLLTLAGTVIGIMAGAALTHLIASMIYGVRPTDPLTFAAVSLLLTGIALLACYVPARRAMRIDPLVALRYE
jgi:predicted permease